LSSSLREAVLAWIERELRRRGFEVRRDAVVEHEGFRHRVDLLAETTLLGSVRLSIAFLVFEHRVDVEAIERAIAWKDVLGLDKVVAVAIAGTDGEVAALAHRKGIDLVFIPEHIAEKVSAAPIPEAACIHVEPLASLSDALRELEDIARGGILRRGRSRLAQVALLYLPIAMYRVEMRSGEGEVVEGVVSIDGYRGYPVYRRGKSLEIGAEEGPLTDLDPEALSIVKLLVEREGSSATVSEISEELGIEADRVLELVEQLSSRAIVDYYGDVVELRGLDLSRFVDVEALAKSRGAALHQGLPREGRGRLVLSVTARLGNVENLIEALGGRVTELRIAYYPIYVALAVESRNGVVRERLVAVDALSLERVEGFDAIGSDPQLVEDVKRCGDLRSG